MTARLEGLAERGQILISPRVQSRIVDLFEIESIGQQQIKGRLALMEVYQVKSELK